MKILILNITAFIFVCPIFQTTEVVAQQASQASIQPYLKKSLDKKEAYIWYLQNSGWAIKTKNRFLIFDYVEGEATSSNASLSNGRINSAEIKDQNVTVLVTHLHQDHYSTRIFDWENEIKNIKYLFGWSLEKDGQYLKFNPRESKKIDDIEITTIKSTDLGVGFLVKVDGLNIFHAGDHARWNDTFKQAYEEEINFVADNSIRIDLAFIPVATGFRAGCKPNDSIDEGARYAIEKLKPKIAFPMHVMCKDMHYVYKDFAESEKNNIFLNTKIVAATNSGDLFYFKDNQIRKIEQ